MTADKVIEWLAGDDTGASSKSLAFEYLGKAYNRIDAPYDPDDLGRCLRLIKAVPEVRQCVDSLALKNTRWARAAKVWDAIAQSMADEVGIAWEKGQRAPLTYKIMKDAGL